jgi:hypothetical protein
MLLTEPSSNDMDEVEVMLGETDAPLERSSC